MTPTTEPAESLDELRAQLRGARIRVDWLEATIEQAERDERVDMAENPIDTIENLRRRVERIERAIPPHDLAQASQDPTDSPTWCEMCNEDHGEELDADEPAVERDEADIAELRDMLGSFAAVLRIRNELDEQHRAAKSQWYALQHGKRGERYAAARERMATWATAIRMVDAIIGES